MGMFDVGLAVGNPANREFAEITAIVDTGAVFSVMPSSLLTKLGIPAVEEQQFRLANGVTQTYKLGEARFRIKGGERTTPVVFGEENVCLLGAVSLQAFGLIADTTNHELIPAPVLHLIGMQ